MPTITDAELRALKPREKLYKVRVDRGLFLHVEPTGTKRWRFRYTDKAKTDHTLSFGEYPRVTLAEARIKAQATQDQRADGIDPAAARGAQRTVEDVAREWHSLQLGRWSPEHAVDVLYRLEKHIFPALGKTPIGNLEPRRLLKVLYAVPSVDMAYRLRQRMESIYAYAIVIGAASRNAAADIAKAMPPKPREGHYPALLDIDTARSLLRAVEEQPAFPSTKAANRFMALTAMRPGEVRFMRWDEVSGDVWTVPAERMKMSREHRVPLSRQALEIIEAMKPFSGHTPYVFGSATSSRKPLSENAVGYLLARNGYRGKHTAHGWRSLFSTHVNHNPPPLPQGIYIRDIVEAALAHLPSDEIRAAYNRGSYFEIRRQVMQHWADTLLDGALPLDVILSGNRR